MVVDYLSRIHHDENDTTLVDDAFPDEHLFHITIETPCYVDIANCIPSNKIPEHFLTRKRSFL